VSGALVYEEALVPSMGSRWAATQGYRLAAGFSQTGGRRVSLWNSNFLATQALREPEIAPSIGPEAAW
jgi:hypothetical protein